MASNQSASKTPNTTALFRELILDQHRTGDMMMVNGRSAVAA
jgi:hypothetical protein